MAKAIITTAMIRKHGIPAIAGEFTAAIRGTAYDWHLAGNEEARKATEELAAEIRAVVDNYKIKLAKAV